MLVFTTNASAGSGSSSGSQPIGFVDFMQNSTQLDDVFESFENQTFDINSVTNGMPVYSTALPGSAGALACDYLRQLRCGGIPLVIVTISIFTLGMLTLMQKIKYTYAILIAAFIVLFIYPDGLVRIVMSGFLFSDVWLGWLTQICVCTNFSIW